jgi:hypothetical protein
MVILGVTAKVGPSCNNVSSFMFASLAVP